jgi:YidC/Oxa1 family membrane protein insertase
MATETMRLYRENKIRFMDRMSIMNIGLQSVFGLGFFHVLRKMGSASRFLWIGSIAKPDVALTVIIGVLMLLGSALMPGLRLEPSTILMILLPAVLGIIAVATLPSAVGLYWAASNGFTVLQTLALRGLLRRRV